MIEKIIAGIGFFVAFLLLVLIIGLIVAFPVMWLWNSCLVGLVAGVSPIASVWQSLGIIILFAILFKSGSTSKSS
jgi:hypothetical protein